MTSPRLYTTADEVATIRRRLAEHDWYARALENLQAPVDALLRHGISIPREKGYVFYDTCPRDNTTLTVDYFNPRDHVCPACGNNYTDEPYYRAWVTRYQSYLSQRMVDAGIVYQVSGDATYAEAIRQVLLDYAHHYEEYPNEDCILGPTRLFQSTYIESLWLASLTAAADMARDVISTDEWRFLRDNLFLPGAAIVEDYDEGDNNRQAMNNAALANVGVLCDDQRLVDYALHGPHGWLHHLGHSVLEDGQWYEGNNYHWATLPAMCNVADALARNGVDLYSIDVNGRRFKQMFDAPLKDLYPDLTFPARKDSRFASHMGQRWYAGMYELAFRHWPDRAFSRFLREVYGRPPAEGALIANAAGLIDIAPSRPSRRDLLDFRGFLNAVPDLGAEAGVPVTTSLNMTGAGLGILRQDGGRTYASLDYGHYGGGHGHPDRMQLNFYARGKRWLTDWGTGNYFFDHLRWYRSSISHNTVVVDGISHRQVNGRYRRFAVAPSAQMIAAEVEEVAPGVRFQRTVVLLSPDLLLDLFTVDADREHQLDWALHPYGCLEVVGVDAPLAPAEIHGENYEWLPEVRSAPAAGDWQALFRHERDALAVHVLAEPGLRTEVYAARAFGAPHEIPQLFPVLVARRRATRTTYTTLYEHREGERPLVQAFRSPQRGVYEVLLRDGSRVACRYDETDASLALVRHAADGSVAEAIGFGVDAVPGAPAALIVRGDLPLPRQAEPIAIEAWLPNAAGPTLRVQVANQTPEPRDATIRVGAWEQTAEVRKVATFDVPLDWRAAERGLEVRAESGDFATMARLAPKLAFLGREEQVAHVDQVRRAERSWHGPDDLSARFRVDRKGNVLRLRVAVRDDVLTSSGPVERHFDWDGVQVYFDPRSDRERATTTLLGIYGLVLVPQSRDGEPARVFPIGPVEASLLSEGMVVPSLEGVALSSSLREDGYDLELTLPVDRLGCDPRAGDKLGFDLILNDNDGTFRRSMQMIWSGAFGSRTFLQQDYHAPQRFGALVF